MSNATGRVIITSGENHILRDIDSLDKLLNSGNKDEVEIRIAAQQNDEGSAISSAAASSSEKFKLSGSTKPTGWFVMAWRVLARMFQPEERNANREGMEKVRELIFKEYGDIALARFDRHFYYRDLMGKPLTVRAVRVFVEEEKKLQEETLELPELHEHFLRNPNLEDIETGLPTTESDDFKIRARKEVVSADATKAALATKTTPTFYMMVFSSAADAKAVRDANRAGIEAVKAEMKASLSNEHEKKAVGKMLDESFAEKLKKGEPITVKELRSSLEESIKLRNETDSFIDQLMKVTHEKFEKVADGIATFFKDIGLGFEAAAIAKVAVDADNPLSAAVYGGSLAMGLAAENKVSPLAAMITTSLVLMHTPPGQQKSLFSQLLPYLGLAAVV